jgi:hypothetical protein
MTKSESKLIFVSPSNKLTLRDLRDDFDLRYRFPTIHALSYDSDVCYMLAKPGPEQNDLIKNEGALVYNRSDPGYFRENFLALYDNNRFQKTFVSEFLILQKSIIFDANGSELEKDWFLRNRDRISVSDPAKIPIIMPQEWIHDSEALCRYFERMKRRKNTESSAVRQRPPKIGTLIRDIPITTPTGNFSISETDPRVDNEECHFHMVENFINPTCHGSMSFDRDATKK